MSAGNDRFFPSIPAVLEQGHVAVWRMPLEVSQSSLGGRRTTSNACTLISIKLAELIYRSNAALPIPTVMMNRTKRELHGCSQTALKEGNSSCPRELIHLLTEAIILGNEHHLESMQIRLKRAKMSNSRKVSETFTVPDALTACGSNFDEVDFFMFDGKPIWMAFPRVFKFLVKHAAIKNRRRLFFTMIAHERCVLIVYDRPRDTIFLFDSHLHQPHFGALVAVCSGSKSNFFADWMSERIFPESLLLGSAETDKQFEISVLNFRGELTADDCAFPEMSIPRTNLFAALRKPRIIVPEEDKKPKTIAKRRLIATTV